MWKIRTTWGLLLVLTISTSFLVKSTQARADGWGWSEEESEEEKDDGYQSRSIAGVSDSDDYQDHSNHSDNDGDKFVGAGILSGPGDGKQGAGGVQGSNFAVHGEACSPTGKSCLNTGNLRCSDGRCICTDGHVYVRATEFCDTIPKSSQDTCRHDIQCHAGSWGNHSRCSKKEGKCECYDYHHNGRRETVRIGGVCYINKTLGDLCHFHEDCDKPMKGGSYCQFGDYESLGMKYNGSCQCKEGYIWHNPLKRCVEVASKEGDSCFVTVQCKNGTLGPLSRCSEMSAKCECWDWANNAPGAYHDELRRCFLRKEYNESCSSKEECQASLGRGVECGPRDEVAYDVNVCYCPKGAKCKASNVLVSFSLTILLIVVGLATSFNIV